jgi:hypothetical protein
VGDLHVPYDILCRRPSLVLQTSGATVNFDVENGTFWAAQDAHQVVRNPYKDRNLQLSYTVFRDQVKPGSSQNLPVLALVQACCME